MPQCQHKEWQSIYKNKHTKYSSGLGYEIQYDVITIIQECKVCGQLRKTRIPLR